MIKIFFYFSFSVPFDTFIQGNIVLNQPFDQKLNNHNSQEFNDLQMMITPDLQNLYCNPFEYCDVTRAFGVMQTNSMSTCGLQGKAVYPTVSLMSHSCYNNLTVAAGPGEGVAFKALRPIKRGDELTIRYVKILLLVFDRTVLQKMIKYGIWFTSIITIIGMLT